MADDLNRLLIKIQADTSQLASALNAAQSGVSQASNNIERRLASNSAKFQKWSADIAGQFKGLIAGYVGFAAVEKGLDAIGVVANLEDQAQAAGVTTDKFQELAYAAALGGASTEDLAQGLDKFSMSMAQVRLNTGEFNDFLRDQAPALRDALSATTSQEQAIKVLANAMAGLGNDSQRATLLQQAFGRSSRELIGVMSEGGAALDAAGAKAEAFGVVLDDSFIAKAKEASAQIKNMESVLTALFDRAAVSAANFATSVTQAIGHPLTALQELIDKMDNMPGAYGGRGGARNPASMEGTPLTLAQTTHGWSLRPKPDNTGRDALANLQKQFDESNGNIQQVLQDQYDQELKQWQDMLDKKQISEQQFAEARTQLGIIMLNAQKENLGAETQLQKEYYSQLQGLIDSTFMDSFANALDMGKFKASQFFVSLLEGFAKITTEVLVLKPLLNSLFTSVGGGSDISGILNGLLGGLPARAAGGPGNSGQSYLVGEHGPEIFTPSANGSFSGSGVYSRAGGGNVTNNYVDARGADVGVADRLQKIFSAQSRQQSPVSAVRQASKRFPNRY